MNQKTRGKFNQFKATVKEQENQDEKVSFDTHISYDELDAWAASGDFGEKYREAVKEKTP